MSGGELALLHLAVGVVAFLYASVGHAGASGYIAILTLAGLAADVVRPTALVLNILVATLTSYQFYRAGYFAWHRFWPFALMSVPAAFLGGYLHVPTEIFKILVGIVLLLSAFRFAIKTEDPETPRFPRLPVALASGAGLGLLSGLTGTGGGVFLTPLMLLLGWARTKETAAVSALFILVNSVSGLSGFVASGRGLPSVALTLAVVALAAGGLGGYFGSRRFPVRTIRLTLAAVLLSAGVKLVFGF
ncbi:MAG: sulfite exporter TauE/SafE family protein [Gemmatimonadales bacterium]